MISFCVFIFLPFPFHISVLLLIPPSFIALFCSLGPSLQRMTTSRSTLTTCWPTLSPRSPSVRREVSADSRLRSPKPKRWWLWWTKLRTSTYKVSRRFVSDWQTRLNHKFNNKTLFSIFSPSDVNMYLPSKLFRSPQPTLNLNLTDSPASPDVQVLLPFFLFSPLMSALCSLTDSSVSLCFHSRVLRQESQHKVAFPEMPAEPSTTTLWPSCWKTHSLCRTRLIYFTSSTKTSEEHEAGCVWHHHDFY